MGCSPWGHKESDMTEAFTRNGTYAHGPLLGILWASPVAQTVKNLSTMQKTWVQFLGWDDPLKKEVAPHSSSLVWRIPWTEDSGR